MVSFFGIKLGSDRKREKAQNKQQNTKSSQPKKGSSNEKTTIRESQYFGNNFSRPKASPRPGTSYSTRRTTLFHQPFTFPPASASMVDLAPPRRRPSVGSLRQSNADTDPKTWRNGDSSASPSVLSAPTLRPGIADRPLSSRKSTWINPLDVHYARNPPPSREPDTPPTNSGSATMSPFSDFEFGLGPKNKPHNKRELSQTEGYPSPPASINSVDPLASAPITLDNRPPSSRRNAPPSGLRRINTLEADEGPPTPERTVSQTSEDHAPTGDNAKAVVHNVKAKRETLAFHQPRQPSMMMDLDGMQEKRWERDANDETNRSPPVEGFEGNFAAFDFGETVRRASVGVDLGLDDKRSTVHTMRTTSNFSGHPSLDTMGSALAAQWPSPPTDASETATTGVFRDRALSDARSLASLKREEPLPVPAPAATTNLDSPVIPPDHFRTRDLIPPRPHTSAGPRLSTGPPPAAAGAHRGGLNGLDPPPRGFLSRPRVGSSSGPSTRAPPKPLQLRPLADRSDASLRDSPCLPPADEGSNSRSEGETRKQPSPSPYGPTLESEGNYMRSEGSARRPPDVPRSPFVLTTPMEGDFPITKGLPRGRQPTFPSEPTPTSEDTTAPSPLHDTTTALGLPSWIDRANARQSAMPAPLSPLRGTQTVALSSPTSSSSPHRPLRSDEFNFPATPTSASGAPRLPSPTFYSLEKSISGSSENMARTFADFAFDSKPLISPVLGDFGVGAGEGGTTSPRRVEARTAPPRPSPVTLPPSSREGGRKNPASPPAEFTTTFI